MSLRGLLVLTPRVPALATAVTVAGAAAAQPQSGVPARCQGEWAASPALRGKDGLSRLVGGAAQARCRASGGRIEAAASRGERVLALIAPLSGEGDRGETSANFGCHRIRPP